MKKSKNDINSEQESIPLNETKNGLTAAENHANQLDTLLREECFVPTTPDEENPSYLFSCTNTILLTGIVNGHIDPREIAWLELRNRGLDSNGKWVGFGEGNIFMSKPYFLLKRLDFHTNSPFF